MRVQQGNTDLVRIRHVRRSGQWYLVNRIGNRLDTESTPSSNLGLGLQMKRRKLVTDWVRSSVQCV